MKDQTYGHTQRDRQTEKNPNDSPTHMHGRWKYHNNDNWQWQWQLYLSATLLVYNVITQIFVLNSSNSIVVFQNLISLAWPANEEN